MTNPCALASAPSTRPGILVVDDDPMILALLHTVLQRRGFEVWPASSGEAAVTLHRQHHTTMALALLDVCMPGMDGPQTLAELRRFDPALRACFMSGNTGRHSPEDLYACGMIHFFEKPFAIASLADVLWDLAHEEISQPA